jgi:hypothetical protein
MKEIWKYDKGKIYNWPESVFKEAHIIATVKDDVLDSNRPLFWATLGWRKEV